LPAEEERGKRFDVKSKADDTENDLLWWYGLPFAARLSASRGSSCSMESFRDEDIPGEEVDSVEVLLLWEEDAREASSRESR